MRLYNGLLASLWNSSREYPPAPEVTGNVVLNSGTTGVRLVYTGTSISLVNREAQLILVSAPEGL